MDLVFIDNGRRISFSGFHQFRIEDLTCHNNLFRGNVVDVIRTERIQKTVKGEKEVEGPCELNLYKEDELPIYNDKSTSCFLTPFMIKNLMLNKFTLHS